MIPRILPEKELNSESEKNAYITGDEFLCMEGDECQIMSPEMALHLLQLVGPDIR